MCVPTSHLFSRPVKSRKVGQSEKENQKFLCHCEYRGKEKRDTTIDDLEAKRRQHKATAERETSTVEEKEAALEALVGCEELLDFFTREKLNGIAL